MGLHSGCGGGGLSERVGERVCRARGSICTVLLGGHTVIGQHVCVG